MRMIALIQARQESDRLSGKVMRSFVGKPMLWHVVQRVQQVKLLHKVVVATGYSEMDTSIVRLGDRLGFNVFTGSENDVLDRLYHAAQYYQAQAVLRIKADCPFVDPQLITRLIHKFNRCQWDYAGLHTGNIITKSDFPKFPDGLDAEIIRYSSLQSVWRDAQSELDREQITPYLFSNSKQYRLGMLSPNHDYSHIRLAVKTPSDYAFAKMIYQNLYIPGRMFYLNDIVAFLEKHSALIDFNQSRIRKKQVAEKTSVVFH